MPVYLRCMSLTVGHQWGTVLQSVSGRLPRIVEAFSIRVTEFRWARSGVEVPCAMAVGFVLLLMIGTCGSQSAPEQGQQVENPITISAEAATAGSRVSREEIAAAVVASPFELPSPVAWFRVFNKLGSPRWRRLYHEPASISITDRHKAALELGVIFADAFIAVESHGSQEVRNVLLNVRTLEKTLGISDRMQRRHSRLGELADAEQWSALRVELEATMAEQATVLRQQRDGPLAELLPIGMLLRTIRVSCDLVTELELEEKRICVGDVTLVIAMIRKVESLSKSTLEKRSVRDLRRCLKTVRDSWIADPPVVGAVELVETRDAIQEFLDSLLVNQ